MSTVDESPESWSEEKLLEFLSLSTSGSIDREKLLLCLDELHKRDTIKKAEEAMRLLLEIAKVRGRSNPESTVIIKLISKLANSEQDALDLLYNKMVKVNDASLYVFAKVIRDLENAKKAKCLRRLLSLLMNCDSFTNVTEEVCQTLISADQEDVKREIVKAASPYMKTSKPVQVVYAVRIISGLASEYVLEVEMVVDRALDSWYGGNERDVIKEICRYFGRIKNKRSILCLLRILKSKHDVDASSKALASVVDANPETLDQVWSFLEESKEHYLSVLKTFAEMTIHVDLPKLLSEITIDFSKWEPKETLKKILIREGELSKPFLLELIKERDQNKYDFALECLEEIGIPIDEYSRVFEKSPILQLYEFFYENKKDMLLENLWKPQVNLRNNVKNQQKIEYFVQILFSSLSFVTMFVDPGGREGVDIIAFSPNKPIILIIGCTTSTIKNDLEKLNMTLMEMEDALGDLLQKYRVLPMVFISRKVEIHDVDLKYAGENGIAILAHEETTTLLNMLRTNRQGEQILKHIESSIPSQYLDGRIE